MRREEERELGNCVYSMSISPSQLHKTLDVGEGTRAIIVGDVHGCLEELKMLLSVVNFNHTQDRLILVGDLVNKGPNSTGVISFMRELKDTAFAVRGNHDEAALKAYFSLCGSPASAKYPWVSSMSTEDASYLAELPYTLSIPKFGAIIVHAGLDHRIETLEEQDINQMVTVRKNRDGQPWASVYDGRFGHCFFGHDAKSGIQFMQHATGLDSGCVYGRALSAVVLSDEGWNGEIFSVRALKQYEAPKDN